ncbi:TAXI family TRAP transporter solute-binding subunit [Azospirillum sp. RWY-5-1]|uniref:TAXI family TRAP transporter solute-binding subunit n=1 Tax=Azospirillum oleiclasticum TaxID=2735135 RepID=A0ABX2TA77_9PROT|nr:TAXI family TRAP transporter solute-binding subunit [Azospirillum oleiclasticum]NYZ13665.1 TAXI family TRAP transporter solute-binding subunit [Azospirillum oleiclasticum]NYZ20937.1 TAXI family TRAP transporter solute-binding subunit [Azospirillum oleiclasticum]
MTITARFARRVAATAAGLALALGVTAVTPAAAKDMLRMSTLGFGSSPYVVLSTFANIINEKMSDRVRIEINATGAATEHMVDAARGRVALFTMSPTMYAAMKEGVQMFAGVPKAPEMAGQLGVIFNFPAGVYHIVTYADSGIKSLDDLKGKTVFLGPPGGATTQAMMDLVEGATGLVPKKDFNVVNLGWNAAHQAFQDRQIDAAVFLANLPSAAVQQIAATSEIRLLGIEPRHMARDSEKLKAAIARPGSVIIDIPAGTYGKGQVNTGRVMAAGVVVGLATRLNMDEQLVHDMTKLWWENLGEAQKVAPWMQSVTLQGATDQLNAPLHPGAARYYRERGLAVPAGK